MDSNENWVLKADKTVYKELRKFPKKDAVRIIVVLEDKKFNPYVGDIEKIKGEANVWRRRIGAYRIFYEISQSKRLVNVFWVERRTSSTY